MIECSKCGFLKISLDSKKCPCYQDTFDGPSKKAPKPIAKVWKKKKERLKAKGSESTIFDKRIEKLEEENRNFCFLTGRKITIEYLDSLGKLKFSCFPHILPKGKYPEYRYFLNNIGIIYNPQDHKKFDSAVNKLKKDIGLVELIKMIQGGKEISLLRYL